MLPLTVMSVCYVLLLRHVQMRIRRRTASKPTVAACRRCIAARTTPNCQRLQNLEAVSELHDRDICTV